MLVAGFMLGFLTSMVFCWFWLRQIKGNYSFSNVMNREVLDEDYKDTLMSLQIEVENLQEEIRKMGDNLTATGRSPADVTPLSLGPPLVHKGGTGASTGRNVRVNLKKQKQGEVLGLWDEGRGVGDIARDTGLGQGEVELILSLRNKLNEREIYNNF
ncbi:MAG: DUF2802 domain-containing protein [Firmicutes bacterium]|nr:DUF2802 domain-containing protein [Bacillota bacterium]